MQVVPTEVDAVQTEGNKQVDVRTTEGQAKYNRLIPTYIGVPVVTPPYELTGQR